METKMYTNGFVPLTKMTTMFKYNKEKKLLKPSPEQEGY